MAKKVLDRTVGSTQEGLDALKGSGVEDVKG